MPPQMNELDKDSTISSGYQILVLSILSDSGYLNKSKVTVPVCGILSASSYRIF